MILERGIDAFLNRAEPLWLYYIGYDCSDHMSNRTIGLPQERGRVLGAELYYFNIKGFLNWGFNAHHNRLSRRIVDPHISADMDGDFGSGCSFIVYPNEKKAEPSIRLMTFRDQMQDTRTFDLLESLTSRAYVCELISKHIPDISFHCKVTADQILKLRTEVNHEILAHSRV